LSQFKKYHPLGNLKFNYLVIFQSLKLVIFMEKLLSIPLKLNFTPNSLGCYGLISGVLLCQRNLGRSVDVGLSKGLLEIETTDKVVYLSF